MSPVRRRAAPIENVSTEDRILKAATEEFANNGFYGARTQSIADAAGVNKAMLHYYFRSKENLYSQVIEAAFGKMVTRVGMSWLGPGPLRSRVERVVDSYMDSYEENPALLKIILREVADGGGRLRQAVSGVKKAEFPDRRTPVMMIREAARELGIGPAETIHFLVNLIGMCVVSFTSPLLLESILDFDTTDMKGFLRERRRAIKYMVSASLECRKAAKKKGGSRA